MRMLPPLVLVAVLMAGCGARPADEVADVPLDVTIEAVGLRPVAYEVVQRRYDPDAPLGAQDGEVVWRISGDVPPGDTRTHHQVLAGDGDHWIEVHLQQGPRPVPAFGGGFEFHLDPATCGHAPFQDIHATGTSDATTFSSRTTGSGCAEF